MVAAFRRPSVVRRGPTVDAATICGLLRRAAARVVGQADACRKEAVMFGRRVALIGLVSVGLGVSAVAVASADAGSGGSSLVIGSGQSQHSFEINQKAGNDVVTVQNTFAAGGFSG